MDPLTESVRDQTALHLYCAYIGASPAERGRIMREGLFGLSMTRWRRVADAALAWKAAPTNLHPAIKPERPSNSSVRYNDGFTVTGVRVFCEQCDMLVTPDKALACKSRFCKAKAE